MNDRIDELLRDVPFGHESEGADDGSVLSLARRLRATDLSHRSAIRAELRDQLQGNQSIMTGIQSYRRVAVAATLILALGALALLGPARGFAEEIIGRLGIVSVSGDDPEYEVDGFDPLAPTATPIPPDAAESGALDVSSEEGLYVKASAATVAAATGVDVVYEPEAAPYLFVGRKAYVAEDGGVHIDSMWSEFGEGGALALLSVTQMRGWPAFTYQAGREATVEPRTVGGYDALVVTGADLELADGRLFNLVVIEAGPDTVVLQSPDLSAEALVALAETMFD